MSQQAQSQNDHIDLLRKSLQKLTSDFLQLTQEKKTAQNMTKVEASRAEERLLEQKTHYETIISNLNKRVYELQENCKNLQGEENSLHRKEIRKYVEGINEKEVEINSLKRQINGLRNKIAGFEQEVNNLTNARQNYQIYVIKAVDQIKNSIKENRTFLQDMETQKMVLESKYRQLNEKTVLIQNHIYEVEAQKKTIEENYNKIKQLYKNSRDECLELKYEVQKVKQAARRGEVPPNSDENLYQDEIQIAKEIEGILELKTLINQCQGYLIQTNQYAQLNESLIAENNQLKLKNAEIQGQINQVRCRYESGYEDQLLREKHPSLYDFLARKRQQIIAFEKNVEKIESYMEQKDEQINQVIDFIVHKQKQCTCGREEEIQSLNRELTECKKKIEFFNEVNLKLKKDIQSYEQKIIRYIEQIKQLLDPKLKKKKNPKMRCRVCWLMCDKNQPFQNCQDCNKIFHSDYCLLNHMCDSYSLEDGTSHYSGAIGE